MGSAVTSILPAQGTAGTAFPNTWNVFRRGAVFLDRRPNFTSAISGIHEWQQ